MNRIRPTGAALAAALATALGGVPAASGAEYVPFVTDFPQPQERYVPFVSDFPRPVTPTPAPTPSPDGLDWGAVPAEGVAAALAALAAGAALLHSRRRAAGPRLTDH